MAHRAYETGGMFGGEPAREPASQLARLAAWIIDALVYLAAAAVVVLGTTIVFRIEFAILPLALVSSPFILLLLLALLFVVFIVQMVLLATRGQTVGKIILKIRVVDAQTGAHPGWTRLMLLRSMMGWLIVGWVILTRFVLAFVGQYVDYTITVAGLALGCAYFIIDSLFIFRVDRRTIHDLIAGTRVDKITD